MVYAAIVSLAKLLTQNGVNVIIDATANRRRYRAKARKENCPLHGILRSVSERNLHKKRDRTKKAFYAPKGIYRKFLTGKSATVPGIGVPYEESSLV